MMRFWNLDEKINILLDQRTIIQLIQNSILQSFSLLRQKVYSESPEFLILMLRTDKNKRTNKQTFSKSDAM